MLPTTLDAVKSMLRADPSVSSGDRIRLLAQLREGPKKFEAVTGAAPAPAAPCFIRRRGVAGRLSVSLRTVDKYSAMGLLRKHTLPGRKRASGFLAADVDNLILGKVGAA